MADLGQTISALSEALEAAAAFVPAEDLAPAEELAAAIGRRQGFLGDTVVVALAGGTGSGKSSLLNLLAGEEVSPVGPLRPTTAEPLAWIPANPEPGLVRLLDDLGVERRVGHESGRPVAVIDLPDYDSVEFDHRATVEALIPRVDAVIWVVDPQKYSDRAMHRDYLVPLVSYQGQFLFVLNQVDRLDEAGLRAVLDDFEGRLESEGFNAPTIVTTAARPPSGESRGTEALVEMIGHRFETKRTVHAKLLEDVRQAHRLLADASGLAERPEVPLPQLWMDARHAAVGGLADLVAGPAVMTQAERVGGRLATSRSAGPVGRIGALLRRSRLGRALGAAPEAVAVGEWWAQPGLEQVLAGLSRMVTDVSVELGGSLGRQVRDEFSPERLETAVRSSVEGARAGAGELGPPAPRRWWRAAGLIQLVLFAALVTGVAWVWVDGIDRGEVPWNLILIGGSAALGLLLSRLARASGVRAGRRRARRYRAEVERAIAAQLQERIGDQLAESVAARDRLAEALSRVEAALVQAEARPAAS